MKYVRPEDHPELDVHASQRQPHIKPVPAKLHVVVGLSNPLRYASRYKLYNAFRKYVEDSGATLTTVELALGDRHFEVTDYQNPRDLQLRSTSVLWHKENLVNLGIKHLTTVTDQDAEYIAWIDSDIVFTRPDWVVETVHLLQTYDIVQMWGNSIDMGPHHQPIAHCSSFVKNWVENESILTPWVRKDQKQAEKTGFSIPPYSTELVYGKHDGSHVHPPHPHPKPGTLLHTGYAWAARRDALEHLGGLGEIGILGSGDRHMAYALVGEADKSYPHGINQHYQEYWNEWQRRAEKWLHRNVGFMDSTVIHQWHGSKQHRRYQDRWQILVKDNFDPRRDVKHGTNGVLEWTSENHKLQRDCRMYFSVRNEDSIDLS